MITQVIMPALGMAQETGKLLQWLVQPGAAVNKGDPLMEVETDKATVEIEAPGSGTLTNVTAKAGDEVPVGEIIAVIVTPGEQSRRRCSNPGRIQHCARDPTAITYVDESPGFATGHQGSSRARHRSEACHSERWPGRKGRCSRLHRDTGTRDRTSGARTCPRITEGATARARARLEPGRDTRHWAAGCGPGWRRRGRRPCGDTGCARAGHAASWLCRRKAAHPPLRASSPSAQSGASWPSA